MKFRKLSIILVILMLFSFIGCNQEANVENTLSYEGNLTIVVGDETIEIAYNDIYQMDAVTATYKSVTSSGEELSPEVEGVSLSALLSEQGHQLSDFIAVRGIAGDGYAIDVPGEILKDKDILLIWSEDGQVYDDKKMPLRMAIHDERSMYWVSNLSKIECLTGDEAKAGTEGLNQIVFLEKMSESMTSYDITYYEALDSGIKVDELMNEITPTEVVKLVAVDDFEKTEKLSVLNQGYIKLTGENAPLFMAPDLPKGMHVKQILELQTGNTVFMSETRALEAFEAMDVDGKSGVSLINLIDHAGLKADAYTFTADDGYSVTLTGKEVKKGILYQDDDRYAVRFEGLPKNTVIKGIASISVGATETTKNEATTGDVTISPFEIEFKGLSDGSFVFTADKAQRKLEMISIDAVKTSKDGASYDQVWEGYRLLDVLDYLHVESFEQLVFTASDGYEMVFDKEQITENMILGVIVDGEPIPEDKGSVQLVTSDMTSNFWVKYIATVEVK